MFISDVCLEFCDNGGECVKDTRGEPSCRCTGSFTGRHCRDKSEFAYIASGVAGGVVFIIFLVLLVWMICARSVYYFYLHEKTCFTMSIRHPLKASCRRCRNDLNCSLKSNKIKLKTKNILLRNQKEPVTSLSLLLQAVSLSHFCN